MGVPERMDGLQTARMSVSQQLEYERRSPGARKLYERALSSLPGGSTRTTVFYGPYPLYMTQGKGSRIYDVDGVERIDFMNNYGSLIPGHGHPAVLAAVSAELERFVAAGAPT